MNLGNSLKKLGIEQTFRYVYKDPEPNMRKLMDWADRFAGNEFEGQRKAIREVIENKEHPYHDFVLHLFKDVDQDVLTTLVTNFEIDDIIRQGKELGVYMYIYTGGEPLVRRKDLMQICEKHNDCVFLSFTNGTLIDDAFAEEMLRVRNFIPAISLEGFEEATDSRRGTGVYQKAVNAMEILHKYRLPYGISACYTSVNYDSITSEEFYDKLIEMGAYFIWYFHYMPIGNDAVPALLPTPEQRELVCRRIRYLRANKPLFAMDFQNDAEYVGGCIAGGRRYLHINANGDVDPCVFIHYSDSNIRKKTLLECLQSPVFMAYHDNMPFNDNMFRPCPMLENPHYIRRIVNETSAPSTDLQSPESVEHLTSKTESYAEKWAPKADEMWQERLREKESRKA